MASVVVCPHCYLQLTVPDGIDADARVQCPACREPFALSGAEPRALPEVLPIDAANEMPNTSNVVSLRDRQEREREELAARKPDDEPSKYSTWRTVSHVTPLVGEMTAAAGESPGITGSAQAAAGSASTIQDKSPPEDTALDLQADEPDAKRRTVSFDFASRQTVADVVPTDLPPAAARGEDAVDSRDAVETAEVVSTSPTPPAAENEAAPTKGSAVTLADLRSAATVEVDAPSPPSEAADDEAPPAEKSRPMHRVPQKVVKMVGPTFELPNVDLAKDPTTTIELGATSLAGSSANTDFELHDVEMDPAQINLPLDKTVSTAIDRTVDFNESPAALSNAETLPEAMAEIPTAAERSAGVNPWDDVAGSNDPSMNQADAVRIIPKAGRHRRRSVVRMLIGCALFGLGGLAIGYYVLLYLLGPRGDFLGVANHLPAMVLPSSFDATAKVVAQTTDSPPSSVIEAAPMPPPDDDGMPAGSDVLASSDRANDSADVPAAFERPIELPAQPPEDRPPVRIDDLAGVPPIAAASHYGQDRPRREKPSTSPYGAELARFEQSATEPSPAGVPRVVDGPSYSAEQLAEALDSAAAAQPGLVAGDLSDKSVRQTKGRSYSTMCQLADALTFCDDPTTVGSRTDQACVDLFRTTLSTDHARQEIARIAPIWIESPNRRHGGVFLAGRPSGGEIAGDVYEYQLRTDVDADFTILSPHPLDSAATGASQLGIVGTIVDRPAEAIAGYVGSASRAIWLGRAIPLD